MMEAQIQGVFLDEEIFVQAPATLVAVMQRTDIAASAECTIARAAQGDGVDVRILGPGIELALQQADHVQGQGIEAGGTV